MEELEKKKGELLRKFKKHFPSSEYNRENFKYNSPKL